MPTSPNRGSHSTPGIVGETHREALGRFLRERREALAPEKVGILSHRGRRTPGLRREEVAFLADIGVKWYARLEAGDDVHPSAATLSGIAVALRLTNAEVEYMLDLAHLRQPSMVDSDTNEIPQPLRALVEGARGVAVTLGDRILTPLLWNDLANGLYGHGRYTNPIERNALVRCFSDPDFIEFLGDEREELVFRAVGMLRLNQSSPSPSAYAADVYDRVKSDPLFQRAWQRRVVADQLTGKQITVRQHALVGEIAAFAVDLVTTLAGDHLIRILIPADGESASKFERLEEIGRERPPAKWTLMQGCGGFGSPVR